MSEHDTALPVPRESVWSRQWLALISLCVALFGLGYNTWRNETTEAHRNVREASFRMLQELGEFQQLVDRRFYGGDRDEASRITAWGKIGLIRDMAVLVSSESEASAMQCFQTWEQYHVPLEQSEASAERAIAAAVSATRTQVLIDLRRLN